MPVKRYVTSSSNIFEVFVRRWRIPSVILGIFKRKLEADIFVK